MALYPSQMRMLQRPQTPQAAPQASPGGGLSSFADVMGYSRDLINRGGQQGAFGPSYLRNLLRRSAFRRAGNRRRRGDVLAGLQGLDPMQRRFQALEDERSASGQLAGSLNEADIQGGQGYQQFLQQLLGNERGVESSLFAAREADARARKNQGGIGGFLGQVAGAALPAAGMFFGGPAGAAAGSAIAGGAGGRSQPRRPQPQPRGY